MNTEVAAARGLKMLFSLTAGRVKKGDTVLLMPNRVGQGKGRVKLSSMLMARLFRNVSKLVLSTTSRVSPLDVDKRSAAWLTQHLPDVSGAELDGALCGDNVRIRLKK
jgi:hypothetical protein